MISSFIDPALWFNLAVGSDSVNNVRYATPFGSSLDSTESNRNIRLDRNFVLRRITANITSNTKNASTVVGLRDDGSTVASITITAAQTGMITQTFNVPIASGSLVNLMLDTSASASGSITLFPVVFEITITG